MYNVGIINKYKYIFFTSPYDQTQYITRTSPFTCRGVKYGTYTQCSYQIDWAFWSFTAGLH